MTYFEKNFLILSILFILALIILSVPLITNADTILSSNQVKSINVGHFTGVSRASVQDLVAQYCPIEQRGIAMVIIQAESKFNPKAIGDRGLSHGLVQIYAPAHPNISIQQAENPQFSVKYLCDNLSLGNGWMWTTDVLVYNHT